MRKRILNKLEKSYQLLKLMFGNYINELYSISGQSVYNIMWY